MLIKLLAAAAAGSAALAVASPAAAQTYTYTYAYPYGTTYTYPYTAYPYTAYPYAAGTYRPTASVYGQQQYGLGYPYAGVPNTSGNYRPGAFDYRLSPQLASQMCGTAVQARLNDRRYLPEAIAALVDADGGRVINVTQAVPQTGYVQVRGIASSDLFGPYGLGAYGALAYPYATAADLEFRCTVTAREGVTNVDISRLD